MNLRSFGIYAAFAAVFFTAGFARAADVADSEKQKIQAVVKEYLVSNPEVVVEALQAFQRKQQEAEQKQAGDVVKRTLAEYKDDHVYGKADAPITLVEYSDFECPYCKHFHIEAKKLVDESNGQINWVFRHLPLPMHNGAHLKALASECAFEQGGNDSFWKFADALFEDQKRPVSELTSVAKSAGLDEKKFQECLAAEKHKDRVERDQGDAAAAGLSGTPGNVLYNRKNGRYTVLPGAIPADAMKDEVRKLSE